MKKNYMKPDTRVFRVRTDAMLAQSIQMFRAEDIMITDEENDFRSREDFGWDDNGWNDPQWGRK
ncbi:MAG: hypothetical protein HUK03_07745 [Bacteroidaceae bacterium]|nr:hypothetical protein [Bacteroidaceae bacterium]